MSVEPVKFGRKRPVPKSPNPLFLKWLTELRDVAAEKGTKMQFVYQKAVSSLNKYPLPLKNGKEAKILQNFGDGICKILDDKLAQYYAENGPDAPIHSMNEGDPPKLRRSKTPPGATRGPLSPEGQPEPAPCKRVGFKKTRDYVPQKRSGGYAVLVTLYRDHQRAGSRGFMTKAELQREAQPLCDKSFTVSDPGSKYTAWSSVSTLIQKDLLLKTNSPARYSLTEKGLELAEKLEERGAEQGQPGGAPASLPGVPENKGGEILDLTEGEEEEPPEDKGKGGPVPVDEARGDWRRGEGGWGSGSGNGPDAAGSKASSERPPPAYRHVPGFVLSPGTFDIVLCVDFIETTGGSSGRKQELVTELRKNGVDFDVRKLNVGDFLWTARERVRYIPGQLRAPQARELVLDYIVERKRMDDLCGSIIDGRFREQKFRLKRCGLKKPIYLVEDYGSAQHLSIPESTLLQAVVNTQVVDGFFIKRTRDVRESAAYLTVMTRYLQSMFMNKTLLSCTKEEEPLCDRASSPASSSCILMSFGEFNEGAVKNKAQTVRELLARQLMQISGISGDKAAAILGKYSTLTSLLQAYEECPTVEAREKLLSGIKYGKLQRNIGPALSKTVCQLYCTVGALH
ncbi:crossover junction endonuclease MUS81-like [Acipenser ruthenus]|uniref:crossover junction endonuclease MUS81-like n=1 Tax=Acipenser ruthenus TaxID=7906 RepID=UPI002741A5CC|nr:crossover junction endonuclease MUS81-like [Acipenser ruthenus]XP_058876047.1 crossover junction endonuclease MUS81-like [Acipenser ruthenus]